MSAEAYILAVAAASFLAAFTVRILYRHHLVALILGSAVLPLLLIAVAFPETLGESFGLLLVMLIPGIAAAGLGSLAATFLRRKV